MNCATTNKQVCKRRNELRDYKRVFANDRRSFRNGIILFTSFPINLPIVPHYLEKTRIVNDQPYP